MSSKKVNNLVLVFSHFLNFSPNVNKLCKYERKINLVYMSLPIRKRKVGSVYFVPGHFDVPLDFHESSIFS